MSYRKNTKKAIVIVSALFFLIYFGAGYYFSSLIINRGSRNYASAAETKYIAEIGFTNVPERGAVTIPSGDITLSGSFYEHPNDGDCAIILLHGRRGTRTSTIRFMPLFGELNCDVLAYDMRGSGDSSEAFQTFCYYDRSEADIAIDWLAERSDIPPSKIGMLGGSYGSAMALQTLAVRSDLAFVVAEQGSESSTLSRSSDFIF